MPFLHRGADGETLKGAADIVGGQDIVNGKFADGETPVGMALDEAILEAGNTRLRPILMTTVTTVLGMLPLTGWFGAAEGTELRAPMALVVIAGLTASTFLTLIVIPVGYRVLAVAARHDRA